MSKRLLGLDIDGVMNPATLDNHGKITETAVYYLNRVMEICPEVDILITSAHGNHNSITTNALVNAGFKYPERIVGSVECTYTSIVGGTRTIEVETWMEDVGESLGYTDIVCVDDCESEFKYIGKYLGATKQGIVLCRGNTGLDDVSTYELIVKLQGHTLRYWG